MKIVKIASIILVTLILIAIIGLETFYYYKVSKINPHKITSQTHYSQEMQEVLWVTVSRTNDIQLESFSATGFLLRWLVAVSFYDYNKFETVLPGIPLASLTARQMFFNGDNKAIRGHLNQAVMSIWVSRNYTSEEAINYILDNMLLGQHTFGITQASEYYFSKEPNDLNYSEVITLVALSHAPSSDSLDCNKSRLVKRAKLIDAWLKKIRYISYRNSTYTFPKTNVDNKIKCP